MKKHTAMQDLRQDLLDTIVNGIYALNQIEDEQIRNVSKNVFKTTINTIISRIDEQLLEIEKKQIIDAWENGYDHGACVNEDKDKYHGIQYFKQKFVN